MDVRIILVVFVLTLYSVPFCEGANFGEGCAINGDCNETLTTCDTSATPTCVCDTTSYRDTTSSTCTATAENDETCTNPTNTGASATDPCTADYAQCVDTESSIYKCQCLSGRYDNNGGTVGGACVLTVGNDQTCTNPANTPGVSATDQCITANAECVDTGSAVYQCKCQSGSYDNNGNTDGGQCVATVGNDQTCTNPANTPGLSATDQCTTANAECVDTGSAVYQCKCQSGSYDNNGNTDGGQCVATVGNDQTCTNPANTPGVSATDQCTTANAECVDTGSAVYQCKCQSGSYDNNGNTDGGQCVATVGNDQTCTNPANTPGLSATDQCTTANAECVDTGSAVYQCKCQSGSYDNNGNTDGGQCVATVGNDQTCTNPASTPGVSATDQCITANAECVDTGSAVYQCKCQSGSYDNNGNTDGGQCVATVGNDQTCTNPANTPGLSATDQCTTANAECVDTGSAVYQCKCQSGSYDNNGNTDGGQCVATVGNDQTCTNPASTPGVSATDQCITANAECVDTGSAVYQCKCQSGSYDNNGNTDGGQCVATVGNDQTCTNPANTPGLSATDQCTTANAECVDTGSAVYQCKCQSGSYDNNGNTDGGQCVATVGNDQTCTNPASTPGVSATDQCITANAECVDTGSAVYQCKCQSGSYDNNGNTDGGQCVATVGNDQTCTNPANTPGLSATDQCITANAECVDIGSAVYQCKCQSGSYDNNGNTDGGQCVATVGNDQTCTNPASTPGLSATDQCTTANAECVNSGSAVYQCKCQSGSYDNNGNTVGGQCVATVGNDQTCTNPANTPGVSATDQCITANAECVDTGSAVYQCKCQSGSYDNNGNTDGGQCVATVGNDQTCTNPANTPGLSANDQCTTANAECVDTGSAAYQCKCQSGSYDNNGNTDGGQCVATVGNDQTCTNPANTPGVSATDQCITANAECVDTGSAVYQCKCQSGSYDNNGNTDGGQCVATVGNDQTCTNPANTPGVSATDQCTTANAECVDTGSAVYQCKCQSGSYDNNGNTDGGQCVATVGNDQTCTNPANTPGVSATDQCITANAECVDTGSAVYQCKCQSGSYDNNGNTTGGQCVATVENDRICTNPTNTGALATDPCTTANAECVDTGSAVYQCKCQSGNYDNNGNTVGGQCVTKVQLGIPCPTADACSTTNAICQGGTCVCNSTFYDDNGSSQQGGNCLNKIPLFSSCTLSSNYNDQCMDTNAECRFEAGYSGRICACSNGYYPLNGVCEALSPVGGSCTISGPNSGCSDQNAFCNVICICNNQSYDSNGLPQGGDCNSVTQLQVTGIAFSNIETTRFTISWQPPVGKGDYVSDYIVEWRLRGNSVGGNNEGVGLATTYTISSSITAGKAYTASVISRNTATQQGVPRTTSVSKEQAAKPLPPGPISSNSELDATDKSITLRWSAPTGGVSGYTSMILDGTDLKSTIDVSSAQGSFTFNDMLNGHTYNVQITAKSEVFEESNTMTSELFSTTVKTDVQVPGAPRNIICSEIFDENIVLQWDPPQFLNGETALYFITVYEAPHGAFYSRHTGTSATTADIGQLQPGSYYTFDVLVQNEKFNSSATATSSSCNTKAKMSDPPSNLIGTDMTSRSVAFEWGEPANTFSAENFGYVVQVKQNGVCKKEEIYKCSDCTESFQLTDLTGLCGTSTDDTVISRIKSQLSGTQSYTAVGLLPDLPYSISVTAINGEGRGHAATVTLRTMEEVPATPTVTISGVDTTSFTVNWAIDDPRPGNTTYTITVASDNPAAQSPEIQVNGFEKRSQEILDLEEFWNYNVVVKAETSIGAKSSTVVSEQTLPTAPGVVAEFTIDRKSEKNDRWKVSWKIPTILQRNSLITKYFIRHNGTNTSSTQQEMEITAEAEGYLYEQTIEVTAEQFYFVEVFAVNNGGQNGAKTREVMEALAAVPIVPTGPKDILPASPVATSQTSIKVTIKRNFLADTRGGGTVTVTGFVVYAQSQSSSLAAYITTLQDNYLAMELNVYNQFPNWHNSTQNGYTAFRPSRSSWITDMESGNSGRRKRDTTDIEYTIGIETCGSDQENEYCNGPLQADTAFIVHVVVCTNGGCLVSSEYGPYRTQQVPEEDETPIGAIVGGVVGGLVVIAIVAVVLLLVMRRRRKPMRYIKEPEDIKIEPTKETIPRQRPKRLSEFENYAQNMHKDSNLLFSAEYEDVKAISGAYPQEEANREENRLKNRYINILPFDHSLVKLSSNGDENDGSDYINANYLPGYRSPREYIGCQGPIPGTIDDFWRMIWEQNVFVIVMLTQCKEGQKVKCEQYWPDDIKEPKQYGEIIVEVTSKSTINSYDFRIFNLTVGNKSMSVKHFHFLSWMDFSANVQSNTLIDFIKQVRSHVQPPDRTGPTIVHCSAGVGRTGTYITLDHLMQFIEDHDDEETIDIFNMVLTLRENRPHMVQTEQQYIFIHDCVKAILDMKQQAMYQNLGYEEEENMYQNGPSLYENVQFKPEQRTNL